MQRALGKQPLQLFEEQLRTLIVLGYSQAAGMQERDFRELFVPLRAIATGLRRPEDPGEQLLLLIAVPPTLVGVAKQIQLAMFDGKHGYWAPNFDNLTAAHEKGAVEMQWPYLLEGVRLDTTNETTDGFADLVVGSEGTPLTAWEGVALITQTNVLADANLAIMGTRYSDGTYPGITYVRGDGPRLHSWEPPNRHFLRLAKPWAQRRVS